MTTGYYMWNVLSPNRLTGDESPWVEDRRLKGAQTPLMTAYPEIFERMWADDMPLIVDPMEQKETSVDPKFSAFWGIKRKKEAVMNQRPLYTLIYIHTQCKPYTLCAMKMYKE